MKHIVYTAVFLLMLFISCKKKQINDVSVTAVYPTSDTLPENLLRMYIQFSKPMKTVGNIEHIKLINDEGEEIKGAIFNNVHELWDKDQKQLTIIFDPSRVKTGLAANETMGRALQPGKTYQLVISDVEDIHHKKLRAPFTKEFLVVTADTIIPNTKNWKIQLPQAKSEDTFVVTFPNMLDFNSSRQRLIITNSEKEIIKGTISIEQHEKVWVFNPSLPWEKGHYFLFINTRLEDPSGNNLNGLFDHKIGSLKYQSEGEIIQIPFTIH